MRQPVSELPSAIGRRLQVLAQNLVGLASAEVVDQNLIPAWHIRILGELPASR